MISQNLEHTNFFTRFAEVKVSISVETFLVNIDTKYLDLAPLEITET